MVNPSKGQRRELKVRLPVAVVEGLEAERDVRHAEGTLRPVDGIGAILEERLALRLDRDAELQCAREEAARLREERDAWKRTAIENGREARKWRGKAREAGVRRSARAQARLPAPRSAVSAFLADHDGPGHPDGPLPGLCPACGPAPAMKGDG